MQPFKLSVFFFPHKIEKLHCRLKKLKGGNRRNSFEDSCEHAVLLTLPPVPIHCVWVASSNPKNRVRFQAHPSRKQTDWKLWGHGDCAGPLPGKAWERVTSSGNRAHTSRMFPPTASRPHRRVSVWRASGGTTDGVNHQGKVGSSPWGF